MINTTMNDRITTTCWLPTCYILCTFADAVIQGLTYLHSTAAHPEDVFFQEVRSRCTLIIIPRLTARTARRRTLQSDWYHDIRPLRRCEWLSWGPLRLTLCGSWTFSRTLKAFEEALSSAVVLLQSCCCRLTCGRSGFSPFWLLHSSHEICYIHYPGTSMYLWISQLRIQPLCTVSVPNPQKKSCGFNHSRPVRCPVL